MSCEDLDEWDTNFIEDAVKALDEAIASSLNPTQHHQHIQLHHYQLPSHLPSSSFICNNFSPPRELTQKPITKHPNLSIPSEVIRVDDEDEQYQETEIVRLKRELGLVSEQLVHLEKECAEIKKDRDNTKEQLKSAISEIESKDNRTHHLRNANMECEVTIEDRPQVSFSNARTSVNQFGYEYPLSHVKVDDSHRTLRTKRGISETLPYNTKVHNKIADLSSSHQPCENYDLKRKNEIQNEVSGTSDLRRVLTTSNECSSEKTTLLEPTAQPKYTKAIGVQTDTPDSQFTDKTSCYQTELSTKLLAIWGTPSCQRSGRDLVSKLLVTCAKDFYVLFRCMNMSMPSKITLESMADENFTNEALHKHTLSAQSAEAAKVARMYMMLTKINNGIMQLGTFFEVLLELCALENVVVLHRSLRIVRAVLHHMVGANSTSDIRDNVIVEGICPRNDNITAPRSEMVHTGVQFDVRRPEASLPNEGASDDINIMWNTKDVLGIGTSISFPDWASLIQMMNRIAIGNKEECVQVEAISIINLILMRSNPCLEIEKFGQKLLFESVSQLLQKEVGLLVQKQALRLLFLLLNCPKLLRMFSTSCNDDRDSTGATTAGERDASVSDGFVSILKGLANCVECRESGIQALKLRRHAIIVLAFVASSGESGFEVLLKAEISKGINFLGLVMQTLAREMDAEAIESAELSEISRERTSLIREALILVNRLASNPAYSAAVLRVLTSSRDMASLTIDVANRISSKGRVSWLSATKTKTKLEAEIIDLARVFRSRVYAYLGETIS